MNTRPSQRILKKETNSTMKISNLFSFMVPKNALFFDLFAEDTANLVEQARVFNTLFTTHDKDQQLTIIRRVKELETVGDEITHKIFLELSSNFITPFDREDIHALATSLDDIADYIHGSASRIELYNVKEFSKTMEMLSEVIVKQVIEIDAAVKDMKNMRNAQRVREAIIRVNSLENHADDLFDEAIGRLFAEEVPALELIKIKEVLANLETATDKCEDVANVLESILVKNS
jgi:predicted phosphate transport protein (TIGR00153 family)